MEPVIIRTAGSKRTKLKSKEILLIQFPFGKKKLTLELMLLFNT